MAGKSKRSKLVLSDEELAELEQLTRSRTLPHREAQRATIIFGYHGGESITSIGRRLWMTRLSVTNWVEKALAVGPIGALKDSYHRPKEPVIGDDAKASVVPEKLAAIRAEFEALTRSYYADNVVHQDYILTLAQAR